MAARVGASMASSLGTTVAVVRTLEDYEEVAARLAAPGVAKRYYGDPSETELFDSRRWVRDWETALRLWWDNEAALHQEAKAEVRDASKAKFHVITAHRAKPHTQTSA